MSKVLSMNSVGGRGQDPGKVRDSIDFTDGSGPARVVAYPERELPPGGIPAYLAARKRGARAFVLWADAHRRERVATVVTQSAAAWCRQLPGPRRARRAHRHDRAREDVPRQGPSYALDRDPTRRPRCGGLQGPDRVVVRVVAVSTPDGADRPRLRLRQLPGRGRCRARPRRIRWRAGGRMPLEFRSGGDKLHLHEPDLDWRLGAALVALVRSFSSVRWDAMKK